jgi:transcriptional regulator with XRE-family HTH domain
MGTRKRPKPERLAEKLQQIRFSLGFSQNELVTHLGLQDVIAYNKISHYERDAREPALPILLRYAQAAGVCVDVLIDDQLDLPKKLPGTPAHRGVDIAASRRHRTARR